MTTRKSRIRRLPVGRQLRLERLESRNLLASGAVSLGPQTGFFDQPFVSVELFDGPTGLGPYESGYGIYPYNRVLLDTGANSILIVSDAASELESNGYETDGLYWEQGVAGYTEFDVSAPYGLRFDGTEGPQQTLNQTSENVRFLSNPEIDLAEQPAMEGGIPGVFGMPLMVDRVTRLDMSPWLDITDIFSIEALGVSFSADVPAGTHRYTVPMDDRISFAPEEGIPPDAPPDSPLPVWAPIPFFTGIGEHQGRAKAGNFLLDTGAQMSLISSAMAFDLGLDSDGDGNFDNEAVDWIAIGGVGGTISAPVIWMERLRVPTDENIDLLWEPPEHYDMGIEITESGGTTVLDEAGGSDTYDIVLSAEPSSAVTITLVSLDGHLQVTDQATAADHLVFTSTDWDVPQTVLIESIDDAAYQGDHTAIVGHVVTSSDESFDGAIIPDLMATVTDDETSGPGVQIVGGPFDSIAESGGAVTYSVVLRSAPSESVSVALSSLGGQLTALAVDTQAASLVFTPADWDVPQQVIVRAVDDDLLEGSHRGTVVHAVSSAATDYDGLATGSVSVDVRDNDGGLQMIVLDIAPGIDGILGVDLLTSGLNFAIDSELGITLVGDPYFLQVLFDFRDMMTLGSGQMFLDLNDSYDQTGPVLPGLLVGPVSALTSVIEGGPADLYEITLSTQPTADVSVTLANADGQLLFADDVDGDDTLVFTSTDWQTPHRVHVTAVLDAVVEGDHTGVMTHTVQSGDLLYHALPTADMTVHITEDPTVAITETSGSTDVTEGGATDTYQVVLTAEPEAPVTVYLDDLASQVTAVDAAESSQAYLVFTIDDWDVAQTVLVTAINDTDIEGDHGTTISHRVESTDAAYDGLNVATVETLITDNDSAEQMSLDIDGNGASRALTDGIIILRYLFNVRGAPMVEGLLEPGSTRTDPAEIFDYLQAARSTMLDVDNNGSATALTDGIILLRRMFNVSGAPLVDGILGADAQRTDPLAVAEFIDSFRRPIVESTPLVQSSLIERSPSIQRSSLVMQSPSIMQSKPMIQSRISINEAFSRMAYVDQLFTDARLDDPPSLPPASVDLLMRLV